MAEWSEGAKQPESEPTRFGTISDKFGNQRVGPFKAFVLYASGAPRILRRAVPTELTEFLVQGTGVILAAALAFASSTLAVGLIFEQPPSLRVRLIIGLIFGTIIFTVDRALVRTTLRPYTFPPYVLDALWDPSSDTRWYDVLAGSLYSEPFAARVRSFFSTIAKASVRFLLAALIAYVVADVLVIRAFQHTVDNRASEILKKQLSDAISQVRAEQTASDTDYQNKIDKLKSSSVGGDKYKLVSTNVANIQVQQQDLQTDVANLTTYANAERDGDKVPGFKLVSVPKAKPYLPTTGVRGCAIECHQDYDQLSALRRQLHSISSGLKSARAALSDLVTSQTNSVSARVSQYARQASTADANFQSRLTDYQEQLTHVKPVGLLIRREALEQLETDTRPYLATPTPQKPCKGGLSFLCDGFRKVFPTTPLGVYVGSLRGILLLIDLMPILLKLFASLRRRRPYDVLVAALEEASIADFIDGLDTALNSHGSAIEDRAALRKAHRSGSGARMLRESRREQRRRMKAEIATWEEQKSAVRRARKEAKEKWHKRLRARLAGLAIRRKNEDDSSTRPDTPWREPRSYE